MNPNARAIHRRLHRCGLRLASGKKRREQSLGRGSLYGDERRRQRPWRGTFWPQKTRPKRLGFGRPKRVAASAIFLSPPTPAGCRLRQKTPPDSGPGRSLFGRKKRGQNVAADRAVSRRHHPWARKKRGLRGPGAVTCGSGPVRTPVHVAERPELQLQKTTRETTGLLIAESFRSRVCRSFAAGLLCRIRVKGFASRKKRDP